MKSTQHIVWLTYMLFPLLLPISKGSQKSRFHKVFITKGIYMLFIVTEILCYIFAILFPPPNKSFPQITNPFPCRLLSKVSLLIEPKVSFFCFLCVWLILHKAHRHFWPGSPAAQCSLLHAFSSFQLRGVCEGHPPCPKGLGPWEGWAKAWVLGPAITAD